MFEYFFINVKFLSHKLLKIEDKPNIYWFCLIANYLMILLAVSGIGTPERVGRGKNRLERQHNTAEIEYSTYLVKTRVIP